MILVTMMMMVMTFVQNRFHLLPVGSRLGRINKVLHQAVQRLSDDSYYKYSFVPRKVSTFIRFEHGFDRRETVREVHLVRSFEARVALSLDAASELPLRPM